MKIRIIYLVATLFVLLLGTAIAQDNDDGAAVQMGPYMMSGNLTAGFRTTTVNGLNNTVDLWGQRLFHEQFGYDPTKGIPVLNLNLYGEKPIGGEGLFDQLFLNAGYDGANFVGSLRLRQFGAFDFKVDYKHSDYFFDRFDSIFTDLHQYDQSRDRLTATLNVKPIDILDVNVKYYGNGRSGMQQQQRSPFLEYGSEPLQTGGYARGNIFWMDIPMNDWTSNFQGSITARLPMTSVTAGGGYRKFTQDVHQTPSGGILTSLNDRSDSAHGFVNDHGIVGMSTLPVKEPLTSFNWMENRESKGPFAFGEVVFKPIDMLSAVAKVNYQKVEETTTVNHLQTGIFRIDTRNNLRNYRATYEGGSDGTLDKTTFSLDVALKPITGLQVLGGFEVQAMKQKTSGAFRATLDTAGAGGETLVFTHVLSPDSLNLFDVETDYDVPLNTITGEVLYSPLTNLSVRGGVRLATRSPEVTRHEDGELDSAYSADMSEKTTTTTVMGNVYFRPIDQVRLRARVENTTRKVELDNATSLLQRTDAEKANPTLTPRRTPKDDLGFSGSIDADIVEGLMLSVSGSSHSGDNEIVMPDVTTTNIVPKLEHSSKSLASTVAYTVDEKTKTEVSLSGSYQENNFSIPATFTRGTKVANPPFGNSVTDSMTVIIENNTIDRVINLSASTMPIAGLDVGVGFNYIRSTGGSFMTTGITTDTTAIGDVERQNGPYKYMELRAHAGYYFITNLGVAVDFAYAKREEDQTGFYVALNNFKASLLTFSLMAKF